VDLKSERGYGETRMELRFLGHPVSGLVTILTELIMLKAHSSSGAARNFELKYAERRKFMSTTCMSGCVYDSKQFDFRRVESLVTSVRGVVASTRVSVRYLYCVVSVVVACMNNGIYV
jgi:hypothetical protein